MYALTALHVVSPTPTSGSVSNIPVISPSGLDFASSLRLALDTYIRMEVLDSTKLVELLEWWEQERCGKALYGEIGVDGTGFREDWCIIELERKPLSYWVDQSSLRELLADTLQSPTSLSVLGSRRPADGETIITNGAMSGWTTGTVQEQRPSLAYYSRTADSALPDPEEIPIIDVCEHRQVWPIKGQEFGARRGDSGSGVFGVGADGLEFLGLLVSVFIDEDPTNSSDTRTGLFVPSDILLEQIRHRTHQEWQVV